MAECGLEPGYLCSTHTGFNFRSQASPHWFIVVAKSGEHKVKCGRELMLCNFLSSALKYWVKCDGRGLSSALTSRWQQRVKIQGIMSSLPSCGHKEFLQSDAIALSKFSTAPGTYL